MQDPKPKQQASPELIMQKKALICALSHLLKDSTISRDDLIALVSKDHISHLSIAQIENIVERAISQYKTSPDAAATFIKSNVEPPVADAKTQPALFKGGHLRINTLTGDQFDVPISDGYQTIETLKRIIGNNVITYLPKLRKLRLELTQLQIFINGKEALDFKHLGDFPNDSKIELFIKPREPKWRLISVKSGLSLIGRIDAFSAETVAQFKQRIAQKVVGSLENCNIEYDGNSYLLPDDLIIDDLFDIYILKRNSIVNAFSRPNLLPWPPAEFSAVFNPKKIKSSDVADSKTHSAPESQLPITQNFHNSTNSAPTIDSNLTTLTFPGVADSKTTQPPERGSATPDSERSSNAAPPVLNSKVSTSLSSSSRENLSQSRSETTRTISTPVDEDKTQPSLKTESLEIIKQKVSDKESTSVEQLQIVINNQVCRDNTPLNTYPSEDRQQVRLLIQPPVENQPNTIPAGFWKRNAKTIRNLTLGITVIYGTAAVIDALIGIKSTMAADLVKTSAGFMPYSAIIGIVFCIASLVAFNNARNSPPALSPRREI